MNTNQRELPLEMPRISWGAVFAGLVGTLALLWLLLLLGSALGVSILDATDAAAFGAGLGWGAIIWLLLSFLVAYYIGGMIAGQLSGDTTGTLHGVTVWSTATVLSLVLSAWGVGGAVSVATHATGDVTKATTRVVVDTGEGLETTRQLAREFVDSALAEEMAAAIKSQVAELLSGAAEGVEQQKARQALSEIDAETAMAVSRQLVAGETDRAIQRLAQATDLTRSEINRVIDGLESEIEAAIGDSAVLNELRTALRAQVNNAVQAAADVAGPALSASELRTALDELDAETLTEIAMHLVQGEEDRAKNVLTANTSLSDRQVDRVIDDVAAKFEQQLEQWRQQAEEAVETASDYTQTAIWSLFFASLLALLAAMFGARMGAGRTRQ